MQGILSIFVLILVAWADSAAGADMLVYKVWEQGSEPYITRILVTRDHLRMDEGDDAGGYTLLDRKAGVIYNVSPEDHSVLVMAPPETTPAPRPELKLDLRDSPDTEAPKIGGRIPHRIELLANGERCAELTVLPGEDPPALAGLRELRRVLARVQAVAMASMPEDAPVGPCDLAETVVAPTRSLEQGLPLSERAPGRMQLLLDHVADYPAADSLFRVPPDWRRIELPAAAPAGQ